MVLLVQYNNQAMLQDIANRTVDDTVFRVCVFLKYYFYGTTTYRFRQHVQIHVVEREQIITIESSKCCHTKILQQKKNSKN